MRAWNFTAGPCTLPLKVMEQAKNEFLDFEGMGAGVIEISHRSPEFDAVAKGSEKLLRELGDVPPEKRTGRFVSALVFVDEDGTETVARGTVEGRIGYGLQGDGGFGYDPLFIADELGKTFGEATDEEKDAISHRARSLRALFKLI